jgi:hypothetical protein
MDKSGLPQWTRAPHPLWPIDDVFLMLSASVRQVRLIALR